MKHSLVPRKFYHAAFGRKRTAQDRDSAFFLEWLRQRVDHFLARSFLRLCYLLEQILAGGGDPIVQQPSLLEVLPEQAHTAGVEHVGCDKAAAGLQIRKDRSLR